MSVCLAVLALAGTAAAKPRPKHPSTEANSEAGQAQVAPASEPSQANEQPPPEPPGAADADSNADATQSEAPAPVEASAAAASPAAAELPAAELAALRSQASDLIDEMAQARTKAALLGKTLFETQLRLRVQNLAAPDPRLTKLVLKLDGAPVFVADAAAVSDDAARQVFEGHVAPGRHVLTAELAQQSRQDSSFGYTLHDSYHFKALKDKVSELTLIIDDDSDMASEYPDDGDGEYDVRLKLRVRTKDRGEE